MALSRMHSLFAVLLYLLATVIPPKRMFTEAATWSNSSFTPTRPLTSSAESDTTTHGPGYYIAGGLGEFSTSTSSLTTSPDETSSTHGPGYYIAAGLRETSSSWLSTSSSRSWLSTNTTHSSTRLSGPASSNVSTLASLESTSTSTSHKPGYWVAAGLGMTRSSISPSRTISVRLSVGSTSYTSATLYNASTLAPPQSNNSAIIHHGNSSGLAGPMSTPSSIPPSHAFGLTAPTAPFTGMNHSTLGTAQQQGSGIAKGTSPTTPYANSTTSSSLPRFITDETWSMLSNGTYVKVNKVHARPNITAWPAATDHQQCWAQWSSYYDLIPFASMTTGGTGSRKETVTKVSTSVSTITVSESEATTFTQASTTTTTQMAGEFAVTTLTSTFYNTFTFSSGVNLELLEAPTTWAVVNVAEKVTVYPVLPEPSCKLPSVVPECQSQWEQYVSVQMIPMPSVPTKYVNRACALCALKYTDLYLAAPTAKHPFLHASLASSPRLCPSSLAKTIERHLSVLTLRSLEAYVLPGSALSPWEPIRH